MCSINIFGLISGYVGYGRKLKPLSLLKLWLRIVFWTTVISLFLVLAGMESVNVSLIKLTLLPIISKSYWYMTGYFVVAILSPVLNIIIDKFDQRVICILLLVMTIGLTVVVNSSGNNAIWLLLLYVYGALIKKAGLLRDKSIVIGIVGYVLCILITFIAAGFHYSGLVTLNRYIWGFIGGKDYGLWPASITMIAASIFVLLVGINIRTSQRVNKAIGFITPLVLSVYLIHVHPIVFQRMGDSMVWIIKYGWELLVLGVLFITIAIYMVCLFLDFWREKLFRRFLN